MMIFNQKDLYNRFNKTLKSPFYDVMSLKVQEQGIARCLKYLCADFVVKHVILGILFFSYIIQYYYTEDGNCFMHTVLQNHFLIIIMLNKKLF